MTAGMTPEGQEVPPMAEPPCHSKEALSEAVLICILISSERMFGSFPLTAGLTPEGQKVAPMAGPHGGPPLWHPGGSL